MERREYEIWQKLCTEQIMAIQFSLKKIDSILTTIYLYPHILMQIEIQQE
jgi:hypothetical protein